MQDIGLRRTYALVKHLPPQASMWVAIYGEKALWTPEHELLATLIEVVHHQTATMVKLLGAKGSHVEPLHVPRPGEDPAPANGRPAVQRLNSAEEVAAWMAREG